MAFGGQQRIPLDENAGTPIADRLLSVEDLAAYLDVPVKTIYSWRHHKTGPSGIRIGKHLRFRWSDVEQWLTDLRTEEG